eukprot:TRINITY_DN323_c0_g1_i1.p1 TRINITY_DN323_c0_g1~~TRINITY_DN323_c0_g1_i1.p1  ORF type:complete len:595 (-),score=77.42 TRINITY_DN323_c0_g1_i1:51-1796(-)
MSEQQGANTPGQPQQTKRYNYQHGTRAPLRFPTMGESSPATGASQFQAGAGAQTGGFFLPRLQPGQPAAQQPPAQAQFPQPQPAQNQHQQPTHQQPQPVQAHQDFEAQQQAQYQAHQLQRPNPAPRAGQQPFQPARTFTTTASPVRRPDEAIPTTFAPQQPSPAPAYAAAAAAPAPGASHRTEPLRRSNPQAQAELPGLKLAIELLVQSVPPTINLRNETVSLYFEAGRWQGRPIGEEEVLEVEADPSKFPNALPPFGVRPAMMRAKLINPPLDFNNDSQGCMYQVEMVGPLAALAHSDVMSCGQTSPAHKITLDVRARQAAGINQTAEYFMWAYPLSGLVNVSPETRQNWDLNDPSVMFCVFGGYLYLDRAGTVVQTNAIGEGSSLVFGKPIAWRHEYTSILWKTGRFQEITIADMKKKGARRYCWLRPGEKLKLDHLDPGWCEWPHGAFAYLCGKKEGEWDGTSRVFAIRDSTDATWNSVVRNSDGTMNFSAFRVTSRSHPRQPRVGTNPVDAARLEELSSYEKQVMCCVCLDQPKASLLMPCSHFAICDTCTKRILDKPDKLCPICRTKIENVIKVFS